MLVAAVLAPALEVLLVLLDALVIGPVPAALVVPFPPIGEAIEEVCTTTVLVAVMVTGMVVVNSAEEEPVAVAVAETVAR